MDKKPEPSPLSQYVNGIAIDPDVLSAELIKLTEKYRVNNDPHLDFISSLIDKGILEAVSLDAVRKVKDFIDRWAGTSLSSATGLCAQSMGSNINDLAILNRASHFGESLVLAGNRLQRKADYYYLFYRLDESGELTQKRAYSVALDNFLHDREADPHLVGLALSDLTTKPAMPFFDSATGTRFIFLSALEKGILSDIDTADLRKVEEYLRGWKDVDDERGAQLVYKITASGYPLSSQEIQKVVQSMRIGFGKIYDDAITSGVFSRSVSFE